MRIENIHISHQGQWATLEGKLTWEDSDRPPQTVSFTTHHHLEQDLTRTGNPFLAGCFLPALRHGEQRIFVDSPCCPWLSNGLETVIAYFNHWFHGENRELQMEYPTTAPFENTTRRTAMFLSGGVDSLFALWDNTRRLPPDHPGRIREAIVLQGFEIQVDQQTSAPAFRHALDALRPIAKERAIEIIPVITNLRQIDPDGDFWGYQFQSGILAAAAHSLAPRFTNVILAASTDIANLKQYGTHPVIDPNFSSYSLSIHHQGERYTRVEKLRHLATWRTAIDHLRVCSKAPVDRLNCGVCEKCIRVMMELLVIGELRTSHAFSANDVTPAMIKNLTIWRDAMVFYPEILRNLRRIGRHDLMLPLASHIIRDMPRRLLSHLEEVVKEFDHSFNDNRLRALIRRSCGTR